MAWRPLAAIYVSLLRAPAPPCGRTHGTARGRRARRAGPVLCNRAMPARGTGPHRRRQAAARPWHTRACRRGARRAGACVPRAVQREARGGGGAARAHRQRAARPLPGGVRGRGAGQQLPPARHRLRGRRGRAGVAARASGPALQHHASPPAPGLATSWRNAASSRPALYGKAASWSCTAELAPACRGQAPLLDLILCITCIRSLSTGCWRIWGCSCSTCVQSCRVRTAPSVWPRCRAGGSWKTSLRAGMVLTGSPLRWWAMRRPTRRAPALKTNCPHAVADCVCVACEPCGLAAQGNCNATLKIESSLRQTVHVCNGTQLGGSTAFGKTCCL